MIDALASLLHWQFLILAVPALVVITVTLWVEAGPGRFLLIRHDDRPYDHEIDGL